MPPNRPQKQRKDKQANSLGGSDLRADNLAADGRASVLELSRAWWLCDFSGITKALWASFPSSVEW